MHKRARHIVLGVQIGVVLLVSLFLAIGANGLLAAMLTQLTPTAGARPADDEPEAPADAGRQQVAANALLYNRNLFNQNAGQEEPAPPVDPTPVADEGLGDEAEEELVSVAPTPGAPVATDLQVLLVGTQVASDARYSIAVLKDLEGSAGNDSLYKRTGAVIKDDATIVHIERRRVFFQRHSRGNRIEYVDLDMTEDDIRKAAAEARRPEPTPTREPSRGDTGKSPSSPSVSRNTGSPQPAQPPTRVASAGAVDPGAIDDMGDGNFGIPRDMAEQVRNNPKILQDPKFGAPPQIQPVYSGGGVSGFRLLGVQPGSVYAKLGLSNGDIIMNVNGQVVDNPQKALAFFDQLGPNQDVGVKINRRGRHKTLTYKLK